MPNSSAHQRWWRLKPRHWWLGDQSEILSRLNRHYYWKSTIKKRGKVFGLGKWVLSVNKCCLKKMKDKCVLEEYNFKTIGNLQQKIPEGKKMAWICQLSIKKCYWTKVERVGFQKGSGLVKWAKERRERIFLVSWCHKTQLGRMPGILF